MTSPFPYTITPKTVDGLPLFESMDVSGGTVEAATVATRAIKLRETGGASTRAITLSGPAAIAADYTLTFPGAVGASGSVLTSDGAAGALAWGDGARTVNHLYVGPGMTYETIGAAMASITDSSSSNRYVVEVGPGTYTLAVTLPAYTALVGVGVPGSAVLSCSGCTLLTLPTTSGSYVQNFRLNVGGTGVPAIKLGVGGVSTNRHRLHNVTILYSGVDSYTNVIEFDEGYLEILDSVVYYTETRTVGTVGINQHTFCKFTGDASYSIVNTEFNVSIGDTTDTFVMLDGFNGTRDGIFRSNYLTMDLAGGDVDLLKLDGTSSFRVQHNDFTIISSAATGTTILFETGGNGCDVHSVANHIDLVGNAFNRFAEVAATDTFTSHFDSLDTSSPSTSLGTYRRTYSPEPGYFYAENMEFAQQCFNRRDLAGITTGTYTSLDVTVDTGTSTGGAYHAIDVVHGVRGSADVTALATYDECGVIKQQLVTAAVAIGKVWVVESSVWTDITAAVLASTPTQWFPDDNDYLYYGCASTYTVVDTVFSIGASASIRPVFEYWSGAAWTTFTIVDGTQGMQYSGQSIWETLPGWATTQVNGEVDGPWYYVRVRRRRNRLVTPPTFSSGTISTFSGGVYQWNKDGVVNINYLNLAPRTAPVAPVEGDVYYSNVTHKLLVWTGAAWETITSA